MCDYSLGGLPNRLAVDGEELSVYRFSTGSMGLASCAELSAMTHVTHVERPIRRKTLWESITGFFADPPRENIPAVCVPPGARLVLKGVPPDLGRIWGIDASDREQDVRFVQISAEENQYRDALEFLNGRRILLQELREGMRLQVLSSGGEQEDPVTETHLQDALDGSYLRA